MDESKTSKQAPALGELTSLRVFNWLTLASLVVFLYGELASRYGLGGFELDATLQKSIADIDLLVLILSLIGLCWNLIYLKKIGASYWRVFMLVPFWSLFLYLGSAPF